MVDLFISVDIGTSSVKVVLSDGNGNIFNSCIARQNIYVDGDRAEHVLDEIVGNVLTCLRGVVSSSIGSPMAIVFSSYLHGLAILDNNFTVVHNVITHLDRRGVVGQRILEENGYKLYVNTGCPPLFVYPISKVLWLKRSGIWRNDFRRLCLVKDYIVYKLFGLWYIDYGTASGSGLLNIHKLKWDDQALSIAEIDESMLPELFEGSKILEYIVPKDLGIRDKVALILGSFDGACQNIGFSAYEPRGVMNMGSTAVIRVLRRDISMDRDSSMRFFTYYAADGYRVSGGASNNGMTFLEWFRQNFLGGRGWEEIDRSVAEVPPGSKGVVVLPFITGERFPFRNPKLRLLIHGADIDTNWRHIARAAYEGIGYVLKTILLALEENSIRIDELYSGGGGSQLDNLMKILSYILGKPITIYREDVARNISALGGVAIALRALGYENDLSKIILKSILVGAKKTVYPSPDKYRIYNDYYRYFLSVINTMKTYSN